MRQSGVVADVRGLGVHDHVCWGFDDETAFRSAAVAFLDAGLALGQQVWYVGEREDGVHDALSAAAPGAVRLVSRSAHYAVDAAVEPRAQVEAYARATEEALAAGFAGLRVATDATPMVATPAQLEAFTRYEHQVDHLMAGTPFSAMCAYNRSLLGEEVVTQLASMHPANAGQEASFRLHAADRPGCAFTIGGELDMSSTELLALALERAAPLPRDGELVVDATDLTFVDRARLDLLADHARRHGATLVLRTGRHVPRRLVALLDLPDVRVEAA